MFSSLIIPNRQWRYVTPLFPILAISAACFIMFLYGKIHAGNPSSIVLNGERFKKFAAVLFIVIVASTVFYSSYNAYQMTARDEIDIPIQAGNRLFGWSFGAKPVGGDCLRLQPFRSRYVSILFACKHVGIPDLAVSRT